MELIDLHRRPVVEHVFRSFTQVKVAVPHYENISLQVKALRSFAEVEIQQNVLKIIKLKGRVNYYC